MRWVIVDKVRPIKYESPSSGGTEVDQFPTEVDASEDYLSAKGLSFEGSDNYLAEKIGGVLRFKTPDISFKPIYDVSETDKVMAMEVYLGNTQTTINRLARNDLTYIGDNVTQENIKIYSNLDGTTVLKTVIYDHTYSDDILSNTEESES